MVDHPDFETAKALKRGGLVFAALDGPGIRRRRTAQGFVYEAPDRSPLKDVREIGRIRALAVPPAWREVWICPRPNGHIQAVGLDARGRRQYRYHPDFRALRDAAKYQHLLTFAEALPALRARIAADMAKRGLGREKVLATVAHLLETTLIRVGNREYAEANGSYGLTTLKARQVAVDGGELRFRFKGKSGREWRLGVTDRRVANIVRACQDLPGQPLFQYLDDDGAAQQVSSTDVNDYLREASGRDITAKDFRTWAGTVRAATILADAPPPQSDAEAARVLKAAAAEVGRALGNTPTVCLKCYIHPEVQDAFRARDLRLTRRARPRHGFTADEAAVLAFLRRRTASTPGGRGVAGVR